MFNGDVTIIADIKCKRMDILESIKCAIKDSQIAINMVESPENSIAFKVVTTIASFEVVMNNIIENMLNIINDAIQETCGAGDEYLHVIQMLQQKYSKT